MEKKERKLMECKRCGHKWLTSLEVVKVCAKCHNPYWNREREITHKEVE